MSHKLVLFCKTYSGDFNRLLVLLSSIKKHNKENIPVYISVPNNELNIFKKEIDTTYFTLLADESISDKLVSAEISGISAGYINQEIIKLSFWKAGYCDNYFCLDADCYFIKDFGYKDFMFDESTPYSVLIEDKELCVDPDYRGFWTPRFEKLSAIKHAINYQEKRLVTCHGFTTLSCKVLKSFEEKFLIPNNYSIIDILQISPYEFSWYNFWLQKEQDIQIVPIEPLFKVFHYKKQYLEYRRKGVTQSDIARAYIGIVLNSNWNKNSRMLTYKDPNKIHSLKLTILIRKIIYRFIDLI